MLYNVSYEIVLLSCSESCFVSSHPLTLPIPIPAVAISSSPVKEDMQHSLLERPNILSTVIFCLCPMITRLQKNIRIMRDSSSPLTRKIFDIIFLLSISLSNSIQILFFKRNTYFYSANNKNFFILQTFSKLLLRKISVNTSKKIERKTFTLCKSFLAPNHNILCVLVLFSFFIHKRYRNYCLHIYRNGRNDIFCL